jgi:glycosyltransferase involved in cell wall biosynthesis
MSDDTPAQRAVPDARLPTSRRDPGPQPAQGRQPRTPVLLVVTSTYPRWHEDHEPAFVHELARRLAKRFTVHVLAPHSAGAARSETMSGVNVWRYSYAPAKLESLVNDGGILNNLRRNPWKLLLVPPFLVSLAWNMRRMINTLAPDAVHAHWIIPQGAALSCLSLTGTQLPPFLLTSHGADLYSLRSRLMTGIKRLAVDRANVVTVVSEAMKAQAGLLGASDIRVEPMGVDLSTAFVPPGRTARAPGEILFVGRLVQKKGLRVLIDAMPGIRRERPDAHLTVVGYGPELAALQARVGELGLQDCVEFAGPKSQPELPAYYQRAAVFVAPFIQTENGDQEGLGLVVVEALGCACPVVVSDLPQVRQTIDSGITATTVRPGCPDSLAKAVLRQLSTPYDEVVHQANAVNVRARFDWDTVADRYASILMELVR